MVEALAKSYGDSGRITLKAVGKALQMFDSLVLPSRSRPNIQQDEASPVRSMCLGLYSLAGTVGVTWNARCAGKYWFSPSYNDNLNAALWSEYEKLVAAGDKNLHLITNDQRFPCFAPTW